MKNKDYWTKYTTIKQFIEDIEEPLTPKECLIALVGIACISVGGFILVVIGLSF